MAIIDVSGTIDRRVRISFWSGLPYTAGQDAIRDAIEAALSDRAVGAILLSIDSPGGIVAGTKELADFIADIRGQKPIAAYADGLWPRLAKFSRPKPRRSARSASSPF